MKRHCNEQTYQNEKTDDAKKCQCQQDAGDLVRRGQLLHDAAVYTALIYLIGLAGRVFSTGHRKGYPPVTPPKNRRGWAA
jgi:hypothetical protein